MFKVTRNVQYYETDAMGVVHHSNYIRFFEEARVGWLKERRLLHDDDIFAVIESQCQHLKPAFFLDELTITTQVRREDAKVRFEYKIVSQRYPTPICQGCTLHIIVDKQLKVRKLRREIVNVLETEPWTETWLLNL